jgi:hypothetical protein
MKTERAFYVALLVAGVMINNSRSHKKMKREEQLSNHLSEFFGGNDLSLARADYRTMLKDYSPEHAFGIVLAKGGYKDDGFVCS